MATIADVQTTSAEARSGWMSKVRVTPGRAVAHLALLLLVVIWTVPTFGLLISSVRDKDQLAVSGWWTSLTTVERSSVGVLGTAADQVEEGGQYVIINIRVIGQYTRGSIFAV